MRTALSCQMRWSRSLTKKVAKAAGQVVDRAEELADAVMGMARKERSHLSDYLGYLVRPQEYTQTAYVTCAAVYGPRLGPCLAATANDLLRRLPEPGMASTGSAPACDFRTGAR